MSGRRAVVHLRGDLKTARAGQVWKELRKQLHKQTRGQKLTAIDIDLSEVTAMDGAIVALMLELRADLGRLGLRAEITGANERVRPLIDLYTKQSGEAVEHKPPAGFIEQIGRAAEEIAENLKGIVSFVGELVWTTRRLVRRPRSAHLREIPRLAEKAGADAVPIVLLINFLMGFVMAYQSARQLKMFGANIYVADLVGISVTRELAPLMTAIIICGRSGAAFAAEIGSMKVSDELDALRTLGLPPAGWLVIPRVLALALVAPILTVIADVVAVLGGGIVGITTLDLTARGYLNETADAVVAWDVGTGLLKSVIFALAIGIIACQQGFSASGGAEGVGRRTTSTVVTSLFAVVVLDALFTIAFRAVGI
jgi:phospholipid/cholesterol/gamma-HCH transport system permease protein